MELDASEPQITALTGRIGAEIRGIILSGDLSPATVSSIRKALLRSKVLFFPGQTHLTNGDQEAFAQLLGNPIAHPTVPTADNSNFMLEMDSKLGSRSNGWHTDITFVVNPPAISVLRMVVKPAVGGDTIWANTASAYDDMPAELRAFVDNLWAVHSNDFDYAAIGSEEGLAAFRAFLSHICEAEHPLVRVHPETGERALLLGHFLQRIRGFSLARTAVLYQLLQSYVTRPENTVRWRWSEGDVAIWDNRSTQHYAVDDYGDQHRVVRRVALAGEAPLGVGGKHSVDLGSRDDASSSVRELAG